MINSTSTKQVKIIAIQDKALRGFNDQAMKQLNTVVTKYAEDIIKEANRIEATQHSAGVEPEITSSMINSADMLIRQGLLKSPKKLFPRICKVIATVGGGCTGAYLKPSEFSNPSIFITFLFFLVITLSALYISDMKE